MPTNFNYENNTEYAKKFIEQQENRIAPNNRVNDYHFFDIANEGAAKLIEELLSDNN